MAKKIATRAREVKFLGLTAFSGNRKPTNFLTLIIISPIGLAANLCARTPTTHTNFFHCQMRGIIPFALTVQTWINSFVVYNWFLPAISHNSWRT
jgi:hypothetical protein